MFLYHMLPPRCCGLGHSRLRAIKVEYVVTSGSFQPMTVPRIGTLRNGSGKADVLPPTSEIQHMLQTPHVSRQIMGLPSGLVFISFQNLIIFRAVHPLRSVSSIFIHSFIWQIFILQTIWAKPWKFMDSLSMTLTFK